MTTGSGNIENATSGWDEIRADPDIQFEPLPPQPPPEAPEWLKAIGEFLSTVFRPAGELLVFIWPVLMWVLIGAGIALLLYIIWRLVEPFLERPAKSETAEVEWQPARHEALTLLEEADRLAEAGDYDGAVHLLLHRSVGQIARAKPELVVPSSTARELAGQDSLPAKARAAFGVIATSVERSLFALQKLGRDDWTEARTAYADFALEPLG